MKDLLERLKMATVENLRKNEQIKYDDYLAHAGKVYSRSMIADEIESDTEFGVYILSGMLLLSLDLVAREKEKFKPQNAT